MLVGAAVCPHPPILVPDVASGAAHELDALRDACDEAVGRLLRTDPTVVAVVGRAPAAGVVRGTAGSFGGFGVPLVVGVGQPTLPLALTLGCWLLDRVEWGGERAYYGVTDDDQTRVLDSDRLALLVMGDASARRSERAPGYFDPRAELHDAAVVDALRSGPEAVAALDRDLSSQVLAAGWPAWQALAQAAAGQSWNCEVLYDDAPYGVGYVVASWLPA
jgi:hypothetical protein